MGPLAFLREVPGPPQSQRKQPLLQPHQSATNSEKQEFRSCSSPHGLIDSSLPLPILSAALLPLPSSSLSFCSRMTSWYWQVLTHASWQSSQERLAHSAGAPQAALGPVSRICTDCSLTRLLSNGSFPPGSFPHPQSLAALLGGTPARQNSHKVFRYALWHLLSP